MNGERNRAGSPDYPDVMSVEQVSRILDVSTKTVYKLIREKRIWAVKSGREFRITRESLMTHLNKGGE